MCNEYPPNPKASEFLIITVHFNSSCRYGNKASNLNGCENVKNRK